MSNKVTVLRNTFLSLALASLAACGTTTTSSDTGSTDAGSGTATTASATDAGSTDSGSAGGADALTEDVSLTGAGATFPAPLYQNWFVEMAKENSKLKVNYQAVGSGAGVQQFSEGTVNFGASDVAMTDEEIGKVARGVILLPMTAGGIVIAYNLSGVDELKLSREAYGGIFTGQITKWNDPMIASENPGVDLPDQQITVVHRSDGSGTTANFTRNMAAISDTFNKDIGEGKTVQWPGTGNFVGAKGNEGVAAQLQQTDGSIGYVEYGYATQNNIPFAELQNKAGNYVKADPSTTSDTLQAVTLPENLRAFITDPEGDDSYPFVTYTWMLMYKEGYDDPETPVALEMMVEYGLNQGQKAAPPLGYIELPDSVRQKVAAAADQLTPDYTITLQ